MHERFSVMTQRQFSPSGQSDFFADAAGAPSGFAYRGDLISPDEEQNLLRSLENLPFKPFEFHGYLGKRRVVSFGWRYDYAGRTLRDSEPIPSFLLPLRERAAAFAGIQADGLQQILI